MRAAYSIWLREVHAFFVSPVAYVVLTVWLLYQGFSLYLLANFFARGQFDPGALSQNPLTMFFGGTTLFYVILLVISSVLTMRLLAEEHATGTFEMLATAPTSEWSIVAGKYLAALTFWVSLWAPTVIYVWIISHYGSIDPGVVGASYLGVFSIGVQYMAIGLLMSVVSSKQIIAAMMTFMVLGLMFLMGIGEYVFDGSAQDAFAYVNVMGHMEDFSRGIVDTRHLGFSVSLAALALFLTLRVLQSRRYA